MFNRNTDPTAVDPTTIALPPLRTFILRRIAYLGDSIEEIRIQAHAVQLSDRGDVIQFIEYAIDAQAGPTAFTRRAFNGWVDYEEEATSPSTLIMH